VFKNFIYEQEDKLKIEAVVEKPGDTPDDMLIFILHPVRLQAPSKKERLKIEILDANGSKRGEVYCNESDRVTAEKRGEKAKALTIAKNLLEMNMPIEQIIKATGLMRVEVEALRGADQ